MDKKIKERFGILIRPTGRFELVQLGTEGEDVSLLDALEQADVCLHCQKPDCKGEERCYEREKKRE